MQIDLITKFFIAPVLLIALSTTHITSRLIRIEAPKHRYSNIDGLRGFLAIFVFLHHSAIWYYFLLIHEWSNIPSALYNHFGSTSVAFFFMITAFLFFSKLINSFSGNINWAKLYVSRVMRIFPLYAISVFIIALIIGFLSHFVLNESLTDLFLHVLKWIFFMEPDINKIGGTRFINSGVQWSLAYEWVFYCSLATIGWIFFKIKTSPAVIILTIVFLAIFLIIIHQYYPMREWKRIFAFVPGIIGAFLVRNEKLRKFCSNQLSTILLIVLPGIILFNYPSVFEPIPYLCATVIFITIACGNNFFGILTWKPSLLLGQISYSIYLLHGFIFFITFIFIIGPVQAKKLPAITYFEIIGICASVVTIVSSITYYFVEKPGMDISTTIAAKVRKFFKKENRNQSIENKAIAE